MSFETIDFLYLAQKLAGKTPANPVSEEATLRSAINRAYYAVFLKARDYLENNTPLVIPHDGSTHTFVRDQFRLSHDGIVTTFKSASESPVCKTLVPYSAHSFPRIYSLFN